MASSQRGKSLENDEYDPYEVALARLDSIQSEYMKKLRDARDTFDNNRISIQENIRERQREVQLLQQELQRKETELQEKEQELKDEENKFHVILRQEKQNRKRKLEPYLRISPAPIEERDRESTDVTRGRTEVGSPRQNTNNDAGRQLQETIVIDSEEASSDEWVIDKPLMTSAISPSKRQRTSEVGQSL
ncbi:hypothetical protein F5Y00DRAFT_235745 [Daldinia vernicosa]|uniref:uncharacterized protein n=1 Tax=Daldinia vernicosa TaxID=114800 RepID=UPI002007497A|nr:uncharacterized protein F5Y00DRAFT_235745 [Daldinia vernicosa]KAI0849463.1 hypothetical protein F5Y00DRAFT_235745 [Daldinia vernicosa]